MDEQPGRRISYMCEDEDLTFIYVCMRIQLLMKLKESLVLRSTIGQILDAQTFCWVESAIIIQIQVIADKLC